MRQDNDSFPLLFKLFHYRNDLADARPVKVCEGLVKDQKLALHGKNSSHGKTALFSAAHRSCAHVFFFKQASFFQRGGRPFLRLAFWKAQILHAEHNVFPRRFAQYLGVRVLKDKASLKAFLNDNPSRRRLVQLRDQGHQDAFSGAVGAGDKQKVALEYVKRNVVQR